MVIFSIVVISFMILCFVLDKIYLENYERSKNESAKKIDKNFKQGRGV